MKRKLIYSVSICVLAFTLVSAIFVEKPTKILIPNVTDIYDPTAKIDTPILVNQGDHDDKVVFTVENQTGCADLDVNMWFGLNNDPISYIPVSGIIRDNITPMNPVTFLPGSVTFTVGDILGQHPTAIKPFSITNFIMEIKWGGIWTTVMPSFKPSESPKLFLNTSITDANDPCRCVEVVWDPTAHKIILRTPYGGCPPGD